MIASASPALFLDGRTSFASRKTRSVSLDALAETAIPSNSPQLLLHMSFCGSTHLAQLAGGTGAAVVLKEPQALVDLADWHRALVEQELRDPAFDLILERTLQLLHRRWAGQGPTLVKPSNWANNLIEAPLGPADVGAVLVTIGERAFLRAVFRGGRDRLAFTARVAAHLAGAARRSDLVAAAVAAGDDPLDRAARLTLVAHRLQTRLFDQIERSVRIDQTALLCDPHQALGAALAGWGLTADEHRIDEAIRKLGARDSKSPGRPFTLAGQDNEDRLVEQHHGARFDRALDWADVTSA